MHYRDESPFKQKLHAISECSVSYGHEILGVDTYHIT